MSGRFTNDARRGGAAWRQVGLLLACSACSAGLFGAESVKMTLGGAEVASATPPPAKVTQITASQEVTFSQQNRTAVFVGNVAVKDPDYTLSCDTLTAVLKKQGSSSDTAAAKPGVTPGVKKASSPAPSQGSGAADATGSSNLERAIAEGSVVIIQDKLDPKTGKVQHYIGKGAKAIYDTTTGDVTLTGWPQIEQDTNTHVSLSEHTVMVINRAGTIRTRGPSTTTFTQAPEPSPAPAPAPAAAASR